MGPVHWTVKPGSGAAEGIAPGWTGKGRNRTLAAYVAKDMEAVMPGLGLGGAVRPRASKTGAASAAGAAAGAAAAAQSGRAVALTSETQAQFELMRRCQGAEVGAFEDLVARFQPRVRSVIHGILRNSNDAEDIAQQVFAKVYFSLAKFDFRSAVATWIYKIAVNECYDHLRKQKVRKAVLLADLSEQEAARVENLDVAGLSGAPGLERKAEMRELASKLLATVSAEDRILLVLKEVEGYSVEEVAGMVGLNENTVKVKLFRARQKLLARIKRKRL